MRKTSFVAVATASFVVAGVATADIVEVEPNDTMGTATPIVRQASPWADVGVMMLTAGGDDVDFFSIELSAGEIITVITTPFDDPFTDPDTMAALFDSDGNEVAFNDDGGPGFGSAYRFVVEVSGTYFIAITGFNDRDFNGGHNQDGAYALTVSIVPAPPALALLAGGLFMRRRRRRA